MVLANEIAALSAFGFTQTAIFLSCRKVVVWSLRMEKETFFLRSEILVLQASVRPYNILKIAV